MRYLLIQFFRKPGGQIDEQVSMSKRVKPADISSVNVILDFAEKKIIKCVIEGKKHESDWDRMYNYYKKIYPDIIDQLDREANTSAKIDK